MQAQMIGSINCFIATGLKVGRKHLSYDGTTLGMVNVAVAHGAKPEQIVTTEDGTRFRIVSAPHDRRAGGYWASRIPHR